MLSLSLKEWAKLISDTYIYECVLYVSSLPKKKKKKKTKNPKAGLWGIIQSLWQQMQYICYQLFSALQKQDQGGEAKPCTVSLRQASLNFLASFLSLFMSVVFFFVGFFCFFCKASSSVGCWDFCHSLLPHRKIKLKELHTSICVQKCWPYL